MNHFYDSFLTPSGEFSVAVNDAGAIVAAAFGNVSDLRERFDAGTLNRGPVRLAAVRHQVAEYFSGDRDAFDLPLAPIGTAFQQSVWKALLEIPFGETRTYGELAAALRHEGAARAVGRANATNPICVFIPCHRVIGRDGSLTGYAFGEEIKRQLLEHEGALHPV
ncbi:MAG: methylated-DNA--[protein]-cysteine S-methyltransferase [Verrucomicrobia bacterium]|nr:methylated-DNA--[protein]-cysteine S-methyltransferase [Verrucomicrobiota bacterium]